MASGIITTPRKMQTYSKRPIQASVETKRIDHGREAGFVFGSNDGLELHMRRNLDRPKRYTIPLSSIRRTDSPVPNRVPISRFSDLTTEQQALSRRTIESWKIMTRTRRLRKEVQGLPKVLVSNPPRHSTGHNVVESNTFPVPEHPDASLRLTRPEAILLVHVDNKGDILEDVIRRSGRGLKTPRNVQAERTEFPNAPTCSFKNEDNGNETPGQIKNDLDANAEKPRLPSPLSKLDRKTLHTGIDIHRNHAQRPIDPPSPSSGSLSDDLQRRRRTQLDVYELPCEEAGPGNDQSAVQAERHSGCKYRPGNARKRRVPVESTTQCKRNIKRQKTKSRRRLPVKALIIVSDRLNLEVEKTDDDLLELSHDPILQPFDESNKSHQLHGLPEFKVVITPRKNGFSFNAEDFRIPEEESPPPRSHEERLQIFRCRDGFEGEEANPIGRMLPTKKPTRWSQSYPSFKLQMGPLTLVASRSPPPKLQSAGKNRNNQAEDQGSETGGEGHQEVDPINPANNLRREKQASTTPEVFNHRPKPMTTRQTNSSRGRSSKPGGLPLKVKFEEASSRDEQKSSSIQRQEGFYDVRSEETDVSQQLKRVALMPQASPRYRRGSGYLGIDQQLKMVSIKRRRYMPESESDESYSDENSPVLEAKDSGPKVDFKDHAILITNQAPTLEVNSEHLHLELTNFENEEVKQNDESRPKFEHYTNQHDEIDISDLAKSSCKVDDEGFGDINEGIDEAQSHAQDDLPEPFSESLNSREGGKFSFVQKQQFRNMMSQSRCEVLVMEPGGQASTTSPQEASIPSIRIMADHYEEGDLNPTKSISMVEATKDINDGMTPSQPHTAELTNLCEDLANRRPRRNQSSMIGASRQQNSTESESTTSESTEIFSIQATETEFMVEQFQVSPKLGESYNFVISQDSSLPQPHIHHIEETIKQYEEEQSSRQYLVPEKSVICEQGSYIDTTKVALQFSVASMNLKRSQSMLTPAYHSRHTHDPGHPTAQSIVSSSKTRPTASSHGDFILGVRIPSSGGLFTEQKSLKELTRRASQRLRTATGSPIRKQRSKSLIPRLLSRVAGTA